MKFVRSIGQVLESWRSYNRTVHELNSLSNRDLNDLGITRGDIRAIAMEKTLRR